MKCKLNNFNGEYVLMMDADFAETLVSSLRARGVRALEFLQHEFRRQQQNIEAHIERPKDQSRRIGDQN